MSDNGPQFPPPHADGRVVAPTAPGSVGQTSSTSNNRRVLRVAAICAAVVAVSVIGFGAWFATRGREPTVGPAPTTNPTSSPTAAEWPISPKLRHSFTIRGVPEPYAYGPRLGGTADDFYILESGPDASTVTRYVDGEVNWKTEVGRSSAGLLQLVGERVLVNTYNPDLEGGSELAGLDALSGQVIWTIESPDLAYPRTAAGRYYLLQGRGYGDTSGRVIEFDASSGSELAGFDGTGLYEVASGYVSVDQAASTAQFIDFDLQPVGDPVGIEPSRPGDFPSWAADRNADGWLYFANRNENDDDLALVGLTLDGEPAFECSASTDEVYRVYRVDETTVVAEGFDGVEVFDVNGTVCTARWGLPSSDERVLFHNDLTQRIEVRTFPVDSDGTIDRYGQGSTIEILDWQTGEPVATGIDDLVTDSDGRTATHEGDAIVAREPDGAERWRIDAPAGSDFAIFGSTVAVIVPRGDLATLELYTDLS